MARTPAGADGQKVTEGIGVRIFLSDVEHMGLQRLAVQRGVEEQHPVSMAQVIRELIRQGVGLDPRRRRKKVRKDERCASPEVAGSPADGADAPIAIVTSPPLRQTGTDD